MKKVYEKPTLSVVNVLLEDMILTGSIDLSDQTRPGTDALSKEESDWNIWGGSGE